MARFIVSGLLAILAITQYSQAVSLEECLKLAIDKGVPELRIPSHNPLVIKEDITFSFNNVMGQSLSFVLKNLTWTNLPFYRVLSYKAVNESAALQKIESEIRWEKFEINFDYDYQLGSDKKSGDVQLLFKNVVWSGEWEETRPDSAGVKKINYLNVKQVSDSRSIRSTGFDTYTVIFDNVILSLFDIFAEIHINELNLVGKGLAAKINKFWYGNPTYYNKFVSWCNSQNSTLY